MSSVLNTVWKLFFVITFSSGLAAEEDSITIDFKASEPTKIFHLPKNIKMVIKIIGIPSSCSVVLVQAHSHIEILTLADQPVASVHNSVSGRNIGLAVKMENSESEKQVWLTNSNPSVVQVFLKVSSLDSYGPVPGGCNMEFPVEIAPFLKLKNDSLKLYLEYQHASFGFKRDEKHIKCSLSSPYISYEMFVLFLEENNFGESEYLQKVELMSNASSIRKYSNQVTSYSLHPDTRYSFFLYPNVGVVYNVIAKYTINNEVKESAYIPIVTYGCSPSEFTKYGCNFDYSLVGEIYLFSLSIYGFIVAFFGHSIIGSVVLFFGLLVCCLVGIILIGRYLDFSKQKTANLSMIVGIVGGLGVFFLWLFIRHPLVFLLLDGPALGFLLTATFLYSPIGNSEVFVNDRNFWSVLGTGILLIAVLTLILPKLMTMIASSIIGSYVMLLFFDDFVGTRLSFIVLNIVKRAVSKKLDFASNDLPFQTNDIIMSSVWVILSILALVAWYKKPFSSVLNKRNASNGIVYRYEQPNSRNSMLRQVPILSEQGVSQPFLRQSTHVSYQTF